MVSEGDRRKISKKEKSRRRRVETKSKKKIFMAAFPAAAQRAKNGRHYKGVFRDTVSTAEIGSVKKLPVLERLLRFRIRSRSDWFAEIESRQPTPNRLVDGRLLDRRTKSGGQSQYRFARFIILA
jgi:hypothetical protein